MAISQTLLDEIIAIGNKVKARGFELQLVASTEAESADPVTVVSKPKKKKRRSGMTGYWQKIRSYAKRNGVTPSEARQALAKDVVGDILSKPAKASNNSRFKLAAATKSKKSSRRQKAYWKAIKEIREIQKVSTSEAKVIYRKKQTA